MASHHEGSARERRALDAFIKLNRAGDTMASRLNQALLADGITPAQLAVLEALFHLGTMSAGELGRKLLRSNPSMTIVLDNLERDGHVTRVRSDADRRVVDVSLTPEGRRLIARIFPAHARRIADLMGALSAEEQVQLGRLCKKLGLAAKAE